MLSAALGLCGSALLASAGVPTPDYQQQVLLSPNDHHYQQDSSGVLYRFHLNTTDSAELSQLAEKHDLDVWHSRPEYADVYFPHFDAYTSAVDALEEISTHHEPHYIAPDLTSLHHHPFDDWSSLAFLNTTFHASYHPLYELEMFIHQIAELYPQTVTIENLGHSATGREMLGLKLSKPSETGQVKPGFVITGASHAREWVATTTAFYLTHALVASDSEYSQLLDNFDFYIIPIPNPDGYVYSWESDRYWYKNRQIMGPNLKCVGLDMNRNWGYKWKPHAGGSPVFRDIDEEEDVEDMDDDNKDEEDLRRRKPHSRAPKKPKPPINPCSHFFPGHRPFESPEVNDIANWMTTLPRLKAFLDLRAYGQMLSTPYSYTCKRSPKDSENQVEAAMGAVHAAHNVHGESYAIGSLCDLLYTAPGNIMDWMYKRQSIKYSFSAHLRDTGTYGFSLPAKQIRPVGEETISMVKYLADFIVTRDI